MHPELENLRRYVHGELVASEAAEIGEHIAACGSCSAQVRAEIDDERWLSGVLQVLDHPAPPVSTADVIARARSRRRDTSWMRRAAVAVAAVGLAGAAYALPGSPLRELVARVLARGGEEPTQVTDRTPPAAGIAVVPGERFTIVVEESASADLTIRFINESEIAVRATRGSAAFTAGAGRLFISGIEPATSLDIQLPENAPWVEIRHGAMRILLKDAQNIVSDAARDDGGRYRFRLRGREVSHPEAIR